LIFVDTGAFLALYMKRDQYHRKASAIFPSLPRPFSTSNHVVDELATLLGRIAGYRYAADRIENLYASASVEVLPATREDEMEAIRWMRKYADKEISFTDSVSFAMMHRFEIRTAFTFDRTSAMPASKSSAPRSPAHSERHQSRSTPHCALLELNELPPVPPRRMGDIAPRYPNRYGRGRHDGARTALPRRVTSRSLDL
jgi:predicted nucleic acid-binding protein